MNQYYILELQQYYPSMEFGHIVHFAYDADPGKARLKAEAKYHEVLAAAAVSELPSHSATLITSDGRVVMNQCYKHAIPTPEPTPEPEVEPEEPIDSETEPTE